MENKINQQKLDFSCGAGNAAVNLFTGRMLFEHPDISMGSNSYEIGISHIYNSQSEDSLPTGVDTYMGKGWRLNIQVYMVANNTNFEYFDSYGYCHQFEQLSGSRYYDTTGLGLIYDSNTRTITDNSGNKMVFDSAGRLNRTISCINSNITKEFVYLNNKIFRVYDGRHYAAPRPARYFEFEYNEQGCCKAIICQTKLSGVFKESKRILYSYDDNGRLIKISVKAGNKFKDKAYFQYEETGSMIYAIDGEDKTALNITYRNELLDDRKAVEKIRTGSAVVAPIISGIGAAVVMGDGIRCGDGERFGNKTPQVIGNTITGFSELKHTVFQYVKLLGKHTQTVVTTEKGIAIEYDFNKNGFTTGILELRNGNTNDLMTLTKDGGVPFPLSGNSCNIKINNAEAISVNIKYSFSNYFEFSQKGKKDSVLYVCSFWMRHYSDTEKQIKVKLNIRNPNVYPDSDQAYETDIDSTAFGVWQYVSIETRFDNSSSLDRLSLACMDSDGSNINFDLANMRFSAGADTHLKFSYSDSDRINVNNFQEKNLDDYNYLEITAEGSTIRKDLKNKIVLNGVTEFFHNKNFFITQEDIIKTLKNMQLYPSNFELIYCGGTKRMANVSKLRFLYEKIDGWGDLVEYYKDLKIYSEDGLANIFAENFSPDGKGGNRNYFYFSAEGIRQVFEARQYAHSCFEPVNSSDKYNRSESFADYYGRMFYNQNSYGIKERYIYDTYGNIEQVILEHAETAEKIIKKVQYETTNAKDRENITLSELSQGYNQTLYQYSNPFCNMQQTTAHGQTVENEFNAYEDSLSALTSRKQNTVGEDGVFNRHSNEFDVKGRIKIIEDIFDHKYRFEYDVFGRIKNFYDVNPYSGTAEKIMEKEYNDNIGSIFINNKRYDNCQSVKDKYYNNAQADIKETVVDKYAHPIKTTEGTNTTTFRYQSSPGSGGIYNDDNPYTSSDARYNEHPVHNESPSAAKITQISDPYDGMTYTYHYDSDNLPVGYNASQPNNSSGAKPVSLQQISKGETKISFGQAEKYKTEVEYEDDLISPRVKGVKIHQDVDNNAGDHFKEVEAFTYRYEYDKLGRLEKRTQSGRPMDTIYTYKANTPLLNSVNHSYYRNHAGDQVHDYKLNYAYGYDSASGNITSVNHDVRIREYVSNQWQTQSEYNQTIIYSYDEAGRLLLEDNPVMNKKNEYRYSGGKITAIYDQNNPKYFIPGMLVPNYSYSYNNGRVSSYSRFISASANPQSEDKFFIYDNYGNIKKYGSAELKWTRGNLLSEYGERKYYYNAQGVRFKKSSLWTTTQYYLDGSKILGEDRSDGVRLRYIYDAAGLHGLIKYNAWYDQEYYLYVKDGLGNITGLVREYAGDGNAAREWLEFVARYDYDAFGNCYIRNTVGGFITDTDHIALLNPFRWKGYYYDTESSFYYINGRYYSPEIMQYVDADDAENLIANTGVINGLDRYAITLDNTLSVQPNLDTIFTAAELYADPLYDSNAGKSWWEIHWRTFVRTILFAGTFTASLVLMCIPGTQAFGLGMFYAGMGTAISGAVIGGIIGGIVSAVNGNGFWNGVIQGMVQGFIDGFIAGALMYCASQAINAVVNSCNARTAKPSNCFIAGTLVLTDKGHKPIEDIVVGDKVLSYDEETGNTTYKRVVRLFRNKASIKTQLTIKADDGTVDEITSTPGHKYYLPDNKRNRNANERLEHASYEGLSDKWVSACELKKGDRVLLANADSLTGKPKFGIVIGVKTEECEEFTTYNFEVADFHTYYVGENGVCVHNMNCNEIYNSLDDHPAYQKAKADGFTSDHVYVDKVKHPGIARDLKRHYPGEWQKVYNNGYIGKTETSIHYFEHIRSGRVYRVEVIPDYWSPPVW